MMQMVHSRFNALLSACVLSLIATASWSQPLTWLGTLPGGNMIDARGVSADGRVVVGWARTAAGLDRAFRWTASEGMQDLGTLPGGSWSLAFAVSADGSVVVGAARNGAGQRRAFRWQNGVMRDLGTLPGGNESGAYAVSADGAVVVGWSRYPDLPLHAVRWTVWGMEDLNMTYANLLTPGSVLIEARAISPDGRYIVGRGPNAATGRWEAFLLDTTTGPRCAPDGDVNCDGIVDDADLLIVLFNFGNRYR
jgi:probable HAF family extracellular repeat protein